MQRSRLSNRPTASASLLAPMEPERMSIWTGSTTLSAVLKMWAMVMMLFLICRWKYSWQGWLDKYWHFVFMSSPLSIPLLLLRSEIENLTPFFVLFKIFPAKRWWYISEYFFQKRWNIEQIQLDFHCWNWRSRWRFSFQYSIICLIITFELMKKHRCIKWNYMNYDYPPGNHFCIHEEC